MNKRWKKAMVAFSAAGMLTVFVSCSSDNTSEQEKGPQFLMGIQTEFDLGEALLLEDFITYVSDSEYTIIVTRADGFSEDISKQKMFVPQEPGTYTLTYTVDEGEYKGVNSFVFTVSAPKMTWDYTMVNHIYDVGQTMIFQEYFNEMNISAQSYYPWEMIMDSVIVAGEKITFNGETSYTFTQDGIHTFKYHIQAQDGQSYSLQQSVKVRYVDNEMVEWLNDNDMEVYNALRLEKDQSIQLDEGIYVRDGTAVYPASSTQSKDMPYVMYNGDYGLNDFVVVDFTGSNMPNILFFGDQTTNNLFYDSFGDNATNKGLVFSNGWTFGTGDTCTNWNTSVNTRYCAYGPYKINKPGTDVDGWIRRSVQSNGSPISIMGFLERDQNYQYRFAIGVTEGGSDYFKVALHCVNLTTGTVVTSGEYTISTKRTVKETVDGEEVRREVNDAEFPANYFHGTIGLYGVFGKTTQLDKVYPIQQDTSLKQLKQTELFRDPNVNDIPALDAIGYKATETDGKYVLASGKHSGTDTQAPYHNYVHDLAYVAFNKEYDFNDFVVFDFTGNNMPYISFFNNEIMNTVYRHQLSTADQNKGLVFANGFNYNTGLPITAWDKAGSINDKLNVYGPNKAFNPGTDYDNLGWKRSSIPNATPLGMRTLTTNANTKYRMAIGITAGDSNSVTVAVHFVNLDTGAVLFSETSTIGGWNDKCAFPDGYFSGYIGLYGRHGVTTTIDAIHGVYENTSIAQLKQSDLFSGPKFKATAKTTVLPNQTLNVSDYVDMGSGKTLTCINENGAQTAITGGTFALPAVGKYTLVYSDGMLASKLTVTALNVSQTQANSMGAAQAIGYKVTTDNNDKLVLASGTYTGGGTNYPTHQGVHDMAYIGFEGEYGLGDFVVVEFTGNNMPSFSFFNNELINTAFRSAANTPAQNKGLVINNGWLNNGSVYNTDIIQTLTVYGPNKTFYPATGDKYEDKGWFEKAVTGTQALSFATLRRTENANTRYRLAMGITAGSATSVSIAIYFVNLDTGAVLINDTFTISDWHEKCNFPDGYFTGSIGLYGAHGKQTTLDKVYAVEQDTTLTAIAAKHAVNA